MHTTQSHNRYCIFTLSYFKFISNITSKHLLMRIFFIDYRWDAAYSIAYQFVTLVCYASVLLVHVHTQRLHSCWRSYYISNSTDFPENFLFSIQLIPIRNFQLWSISIFSGIACCIPKWCLTKVTCWEPIMTVSGKIILGK